MSSVMEKALFFHCGGLRITVHAASRSQRCAGTRPITICSPLAMARTTS